jgi:serine/threonine protein kinase
MPHDSEQFVRSLIDGGLMSPDDFKQFIADSSVADGPWTERLLGQYLETHGKLTPFQAAAVRAKKLNDLIFGNYVVLDKLGTGGMGTVYKGRHRRMKRFVAIKLLPRGQSKSTDQFERFQREVEAIGRLNHPNIVTAYDADESDAGPFLVMEYVQGSDLAHVVSHEGPLSIRLVVDYMQQAARALEYAHAQGIVHRDIKPANLLRDLKGTIKVTDLGLARVNDALGERVEDDGLTRDGFVAGTVDFMSPEQALNTMKADHRADIYSLGCTLYFLIAGDVMYGGDTIMEKILAHREQPIPELRQLSPHFPQALDDVFQRMVAKRVADRYQSMSDVIQGLEGCAVNGDFSLAGDSGGPRQSVAEIGATSQYETGCVTVRDVSVLLVEPSRVQSKVIGGQLQTLGVQRLELAGDGKKSLDSMRSSRPHLVISSLHLPDMTATELVAAMRADEQLRDIPFILISSDTDEHLLETVRQNHSVSVLAKPFTSDELKLTLATVVDMFPNEFVQVGNRGPEHAKVLIADDSVVARRVLRTMLSNLGVRAFTEASNGEQAARLLDSDSYDLVVTDYEMPCMDGGELVKRIRQHPAHRCVPVLMVSSATELASMAGVEEAGVSALCDKSSDPEAIGRIIQRIMNWSSA